MLISTVSCESRVLNMMIRCTSIRGCLSKSEMRSESGFLSCMPLSESEEEEGMAAGGGLADTRETLYGQSECPIDMMQLTCQQCSMNECQIQSVGCC